MALNTVPLSLEHTTQPYITPTEGQELNQPTKKSILQYSLAQSTVAYITTTSSPNMSLPSILQKIRASPTWRTDLITHLRGQKIIVPDLLHIYRTTKPTSPTINHTIPPNSPCSPSTTPLPSSPPPNPPRTPAFRASDELHRFLNTYIDTHIADPELRKKLHAANVPQCTTNFWPRAGIDKQCVLGAYLAWFFTWDDEVDEGALKGDVEGTEKYGVESVQVVRRLLEGEDSVSTDIDGSTEPDTTLHTCTPWHTIAPTLRSTFFPADNHRFASSVYAYITASCTSSPPSALPPSVSAYRNRRTLTIGSTPILLLHPWAYDLHIPAWIWDLSATTRIQAAVATSISLINDIASLKKELDNNEVESLIPLLVLEDKCAVQDAVDRVVRMVENAWAEFTQAAEDLQDAVRMEGETGRVRRDVDRWVEACRDVVVGNVEFHLCAERYTRGMEFEGEGWGYELVL